LKGGYRRKKKNWTFAGKKQTKEKAQERRDQRAHGSGEQKNKTEYEEKEHLKEERRPRKKKKKNP